MSTNVHEATAQAPGQPRSTHFISGAVECVLKIFNIIGGDLVYDHLF